LLAGIRILRISNLPAPTATFLNVGTILTAAAGCPRRLWALPLTISAAPSDGGVGEIECAAPGLMLRTSFAPKLTRIRFFST
jgi:hypothetical protein